MIGFMISASTLPSWQVEPCMISKAQRSCREGHAIAESRWWSSRSSRHLRKVCLPLHDQQVDFCNLWSMCRPFETEGRACWSSWGSSDTWRVCHWAAEEKNTGFRSWQWRLREQQWPEKVSHNYQISPAIGPNIEPNFQSGHLAGVFLHIF